MRVVTLVPSATESVALLGAEGELVGRSHECDHPPSIAHLPALTAQAVDAPSAATIDQQVREHLAAGASLYHLDAERLAALAPDLVITQDLCSVCSIDAGSVSDALDVVAKRTGTRPEMLALNPQSVEDVLDDILRVGAAIGRVQAAERAVVALRDRLYRAQEFVNPYDEGASCAFVEWTSPLFIAGHWTPQLIERAGARSPLNPTTPHPSSGTASGMQQGDRRAGPSLTITPEALISSAPQRLIISPCGLTLAQTREAVRTDLAPQPWWPDLHAVRAGRVALVDGNQMFSRPGPRLVDAFEWLVGWINNRPQLIPPGFPWEPWSV